MTLGGFSTGNKSAEKYNDIFANKSEFAIDLANWKSFFLLSLREHERKRAGDLKGISRN